MNFLSILAKIGNIGQRFGAKAASLASGWGIDDVIIIAIVTAAWIIATVFLFKFPSAANFTTWGTFSAVEISAYHWISAWDDHVPDAPSSKPPEEPK